jgi:hypothetical protein
VIHALPTPGGLTPDRFMADIIARGDTVLLVGIRPGNLPTVILEHPQVCYWPSDSRQMSKGTVPVGTGAVLFSKWLSHTEHRRIRAQAEKVGAYCPAQLLGTGEMRVLLTSLVPRQDDHIGRVVERLVQEAPHPSAPPAREEAPAFACECGQVGPGIAWGGSTREPTAATVKADEQRLGANLSELVRMLDDASAVLSLARETVLDLAQQNAKLQQSRDQLRARVNRLFDEG